jgi:hypothetical protein
MKIADSIKLIENEYDLETGAIGKLRWLEYDQAGFERLIAILKDIENDDDPKIDKRFVSLTWYIPIFMIWQTRSIKNDSSAVKEINQYSEKIAHILFDLIGYP